MNQMRPTVNLSKITIPTGYEDLQRQAAQKRRLADVMLSQGLAPENNMRSWAQVLGKLGQTWAGKSLGNEATALEKDMQTRLREDYSNAFSELSADVNAQMSPQQIIQKHATNPLLADALKPYQDAMARALTEREDLINFGGRVGVRQGDVMGMADNDPNKMVFQDANGALTINPVAATAAGIQSGALVPEQYAVTGQMPGVGRLAQAMGGGQAPSAAPSRGQPYGTFWSVFDLEGPQGAIAKSQTNPVTVSSPQEALTLPPGTVYITPNGQEYTR